MTQKTTTTSGDVKATLSGNGFEYTEKLLELVAPQTYRLIQDEFSKILENAKKEWLVRVPDKNRGEQSRGSAKKLSMGIRLNGKGEIVAYLRNTAEYAWAIKVGKKSDTTIPKGKRLADVLLWRPARKASTKVVKSLMKEMDRIK
jgi:hypothetical protein